MNSLRVFVLDQDLVAAIEGKSEEWKLSMDETVVKILKAGLSGPAAKKSVSKPAPKPESKPVPKAAPKAAAPKAPEKPAGKPSAKPASKPSDKSKGDKK